MSDQATGQVCLEPGIYINLPEEDYFAADALGSTDLKALFLDAESWWWEHHPNSPLKTNETPEMLRRRKDARRIGSATHACLLEGVEAYESRFAVAPEQEDYPDALVTVDQMKSWLEQHGQSKTGNKAALAHRIMKADPTVQIWDCIVESALDGRQVMYRGEDLRIRLMRRVIENDAELSRELGHGISEVSVFWKDPVTKHLHRARFDRLTMRRPWDLKTFTRRRNISPRTGALYRAQDEMWHVQAASYWEAWDLLPELPVIGGTDAERELMKRIQESAADSFAGSEFGWMFCPNNGAPSPLPLTLKRTSLIAVEGEKRLKEAKENYAAWVRLYGKDEAWIEVSGIQEIDDEKEGYGFWRAA